jgi:hypothetical protein
MAKGVASLNQTISSHPFGSNTILHQRELQAQWAVCIFSGQNTLPTDHKQTH